VAVGSLRKSGLPIPPVLVCAEDVKRGKPDPECFTRAAELLSLAPCQCFVVEDAPKGIEGARAAGMFCAGIGGTFPLEQLSSANLVLHTLADLRVEFLESGLLRISGA
jgi:sugar-phosphatase